MRTVVAFAAAAFALPASALAQANPIQLENARGGAPGWASVDETTSIEGYADRTSIAPGETVGLHVASSLPGARYRIELYRLGWYGGAGARRIECVPCDNEHAAPPAPPPLSIPGTGELRAQWPLGQSLTAQADWVSGYYEARLVLTSSDEAGRAYRLWFVVREPVPRASAALVQVPVNTWQAYNSWGGRSLYDFNSAGGRASHVSFDRPYAVRVPGAQATPLAWEYQLVRFLEREGYDVSYQADTDTDADPGSLLRHRVVLTAGHSEYWTKAMRDGFEAARDQGTNLAFLGANNAYWQVRYENDRRTMVGYKSTADPAAPELKTVRFRDLPAPRPECQLVGVQFPEEGLFGRGDYAVESAALDDPWLAGTGFVPGATSTFLVSDEHDWLPNPLPPACAHPRLRVLFRYDGPPAPAHAVRYTAASGARVFAGGTMQFSWALDAFGAELFGYVGPDPRIQRFMRNALADLLLPAAPAPLTASVTGPARVTVRTSVAADPRVEIVVTRQAGAGAFDPADPGATVVCRALPCVDRAPGHRVYRYGAIARDAWGASRGVLSDPVSVPNSRPTARLTGARAVRVGARVRYRATASDLDGDLLRVEWRVDGRRVRGARIVTVRFRTAGIHRVSLRVLDGHGGVAAATLRPRARR